MPVKIPQVYARQAIATKFLGPTNSRGSRIKASCEAGSVTVDFAHNLSTAANHARAVMLLAQRLGWLGTWHLGALPGGYVAVLGEDGTSFNVVDPKGRVDWAL